MNLSQSKRMYRINHSSAAILNKTSIGFKVSHQSKSPPRSKNDSFSIKPLDINEVTKITNKPTKSTKKLQNFLLSNVQSPSSVSQASTKLPMKSTLSSTKEVFWSPKAIRSPNLLRQTRINKNNYSTNISAYDISQPPLNFNSREESLNNSVEDQEHDFTSDRFLARIMEKFSAAPGTNPTTTLYFGRISKQISIKQAQLVVQSLVDTLKFIKQVKLGEGQKGLRRHYGILDDIDDPKKKVEEFTAAVNEGINICNHAINERYSRKRVEEYSKKMVDIALKTGNPGLVLYFVFVQGKLCIARCSFRAAINTFKYFKELCLKFDLFPRSMEAYKMLGRCYQALNLHKTSLIYFTKFLYMAWMRDSPRHELLAYDNIGLQFYYLGNLEKAEYFHTRMVSGKHEPKDSRLRKIGILKMKMNKTVKNSDQMVENYLYDAENDFDIDVEMDKATKKLDKDDEGDEVSHRDEGFEPPLFNTEDEDENRKMLETLKQNHFETFNRKTPMRAPVKLTAIPGFVKAKMTLGKKNEEKIRKKGGTVSLKSSPDNSFVASESLTNIVKPISTAIFSSRPNQQIFTSHLSRNRGLKNFSLAGAFNSSYNDNGDGMDELDSKSCDQIKRILDKVRINLEVIRESLIKARAGRP